ncbi:MAG: PBP1A family penicillin-binding protein [Terriglobales bacterium]|jgi:penicillin-binding protein 1A
MKSIYAELPPVEVAGTKLVGRVVFALLVLASALIGAFGGLLLVYSTDLPEIGELQRYHPSTITELYDDQGRVVGSFALQRRVVVGYDDFPKVLRDAIISVEDKDFEKHWGVNFWRILGAAYKDIALGQKAQGGSTLTMQLSRNLFLTPERRFHRKIQEIMLAIQIERRFTKPQIFALYANQIFLGHGAYGFEAGSLLYFSKPARDLTLEEAALLAGLPKAPNYYSPLNNPERAARRRNLVINAMLEDGKITADQAAHAKSMPILLHLQKDPNSLAPYFAEEVRRYLEKKYGTDEVHQGGLRVYTTLNLEMQEAANRALLDGLAAYERRHGWKGNLPNMVAVGLDVDKYQNPDWDEPMAPGSYVHALVADVRQAAATVKFGRYTATLAPADIAWTTHKLPDEILARGDIAYVKVVSLSETGPSKVSLEQDSGAQGALLAIDNATGDIKAMVGGRDFDESKFNRATQAMRQVGSSFKPYVYTAAIDGGATPDDIILDAPVTYSTASGPYSPHNYDGKFEGNITLRRAISQSRNIPALKTAARVGIGTVIEYTRKFGVTSPLPPVLPLALGAADMTLMEQTSAFTTFPNDGVRVVPRYIRKVEGYDGRTLEVNYPDVKDVISSRTARIMTSLLREVVLHGTGFQASKLKHPLGGKTGTTNDFTDAWFVGFSPSITCGVWIGFDEKKTLGKKESGALAALPVWIDFMKVALKGRDQEDFTPPPDLPRNHAARVDTPDFRPSDAVSH